MSTDLVFVDIVPAFGKLPVGGGNAELPNLTRRMRRLITYHAPEAAADLYMDISWNICSAIGEEDHWQVHWQGLLGPFSEAAQLGLIGGLKKGGEASSKPLQTTPVKNPARQLAYRSKHNFWQRESYIATNGRRDTRKNRLTLEQEVMVGEWLSKWTVEQRHFSIGDIERVAAQFAKNNAVKTAK